MRKHRVTITLVISDDASANALILLLKALLKRLGRNQPVAVMASVARNQRHSVFCPHVENDDNHA
ncbi:hypothetical protein Mal33_08840 [Rosistilla oblonga]|uniref:Uncharacterized protein n=1 Tax=Rosistilla oblonga TaxID=2527990 RepID=A0A518IPB0_9BACT|nr:hypothetical protein Mal33_08840 [Rosistilla oblonga]